jgi:hypothetical protein
MLNSEPEGSVMGIVKFGNELIFSSHFLLFFGVSYDCPLEISGWER